MCKVGTNFKSNRIMRVILLCSYLWSPWNNLIFEVDMILSILLMINLGHREVKISHWPIILGNVIGIWYTILTLSTLHINTFKIYSPCKTLQFFTQMNTVLRIFLLSGYYKVSILLGKLVGSSKHAIESEMLSKVCNIDFIDKNIWLLQCNII